MIAKWLESLSYFISHNFWLAPIVSLLAGILTSFTPCALSSVPLVIGYVGGIGNKDTKKAFKLSLVFSLGMASTFTILGAIASIFGKLMGISSSWWYIALGILMVLMALQTWEVYNFIPPIYLASKKPKKGYIGALIAGVLGGIFSSPCATPVLVVLLALVARGGNIPWGILLLLLYSIGHSVLVLAAGTSVAFVTKITSSNRYTTFNKFLKYTLGSAILFIGFYMFYLGF